MTGARVGAGRRTEIVALAVVYAVILAGALVFASSIALRQSEGGQFRDRFLLFLLAVVPVALAAVTAWRLHLLAADRDRRLFGARLRMKVVMAVCLAVALCSIPPAAVFGALAFNAADAPASRETAEAAGAGLELALDVYDGIIARLDYETRNDAPLLAERTGRDAARALSLLARRDPNVVAVEFFADGTSRSFAGDERARTDPGIARAAPDGILDRRVFDDGSLVRVRQGLASETGSVVVTGFVPDAVTAAAEALDGAVNRMESLRRFTRGFVPVIVYLWFVFLFPALTLAVLFGLEAADAAVRPLVAVHDVIGKVSEGSKTARPFVTSDRELASLLASFNTMLRNLERSRDEAVSAEKISAWQDIAQRLAHELKNPLTPIKLTAERMLRRYAADPASVGEILERSMLAIIQEADGMNALLQEFRTFARLPEPQLDWVNLRAVVEEAVAAYASGYPEVDFDLGAVAADIVIRVDRGQLRQAVSNLVANAIDAMDGSGTVTFRADLAKNEESRYCRFQVRDSGRGIAPEHHERVFTPYFTTKTNGTGLGLSIVQHIVHDHGGRIRFESEPGSGTVFIIEFPVDR